MKARDTLKARLARRDYVIGIAPKFASADLVAALAPRFDYIFIDCETAGPDVENISNLARAAQLGGACAVVRPWSKDMGLLRRYLGCGIDGFVMPDVENPDEVLTVRRLMNEIDPDSGDTLIYAALIETAKGVERARDIMLTEGCDVTYIGTSDLAVSYGLPRRGDHAQIRDIAFGIIETSRSIGKSAGCPVNKYGMQRVLDAGANSVMLFMPDVLTAGLDAAMKDWPKA